MTTTLYEIAHFLEQEDIGYMFNRDKSFLFLGIKLGDFKEQGIVIRILENGKIVQLAAPLLFQIDGSVHKGIVMQKILEFQLRTPLLKFICSTVDTSKQYIEARIDFPLYDSPLHGDNLFFCLDLIRIKLTEQLPRLQHILNCGCEPQ